MQAQSDRRAGSVDEAASLFKPALKPTLYAGIVNHGVYSTGPFSAVHAGLADISIGAVPRLGVDTQDASASYLVQLMLNCKPLACHFLRDGELLAAQLKKLAVNAVINPLTVIFDCLNGEIFNGVAKDRLIRVLVEEISAVFVALLRSEKQATDDELKKFSPEELYSVVRDVGAKTALNISSMRQDYIHRRATEINYINGYIVRRGKALGISCPINAKLVDLVLKRSVVLEADIKTTFNIP
jgi:2-dehydropantoate 2-reductase